MLRVHRIRQPIPKLPRSWWGATVAFLADLHHGPYLSVSRLRDVVDRTNALEPDLVLLGGDYVSKEVKYIEPGIAELARLRARLGRFAVLGNHDHWKSASRTRAALDAAGIERLDNAGVWVERGGAPLRIGGVGDLWTDRQRLDRALGDATDRDAVLLLSHNPDYVEEIADPRVQLVLSGHTHGGQVVVPGYAVSWAPTRFGTKYLRGLCQGPWAQVFVTTGVGTSGPPVRLFCPPEIVHLTLVPIEGRA
jgi:predicted MPP superfamily phosphohydrolase